MGSYKAMRCTPADESCFDPMHLGGPLPERSWLNSNKALAALTACKTKGINIYSLLRRGIYCRAVNGECLLIYYNPYFVRIVALLR